MKKYILIVVFLVLPLVSFAQGLKTRNSPRPAKPLLVLFAKAEKKVYRPGEDIAINLEFRNNSKSQVMLKFDKSGLYAFFSFEIFRNEEKLNPYRYLDLKDMVFPTIETKLTSGGSYHMKVVLNKLDWVTKYKAMFEEPAMYKIIITYGFIKDKTSIGINSNPVVIEVKGKEDLTKEEAVESAKKAIKDKNIDLGKYYVKNIKGFKRNGRDVWFITFDVTEKLQQIKDGRPMTKGGEIFVDIDKRTAHTSIRYGE
ncbi:MAG: hypothetical protein PHG31_01625 [Candidatus Omnitrophica bacterium]|nr:hypothetical protein [Candidatus Omnitrophota bacterium]